MKHRNALTLVLVIAPVVLLSGCKSSPFALEFPDRTSLIHVKSGLYVHREAELRVNPARFETPPDGAAPGAVPELVASQFFPLGTSSTYFAPVEQESGEYLVWREVSHMSKDDLKGRTSRGAHLSWEADGATTAYDVLEIFRFPPPDISQLDHWSPWVYASSSREGSFGWHAEANRYPSETPAGPAHPFQMRFRLVLSERMYP